MWSAMDSLFGPQLPGQFDFTLFFEHVMFTLIPGGIIFLTIPYYIRTILRATGKKVRPGLLLWVKLAVGLALVGIYTANLILWQQDTVLRSPIAISAASTSLIAALCIVAIAYTTHTYSLQSSAFLSVFITVTALFDVTMTRSFFRRELGAIGALRAAIIGLKFVLVVLEEFSKRRLIRAERERESVDGETVAGFWNRATFGWLNSLLIFGYKKELSFDNLPSIDGEFSSMKLYDQFVPNWSRANKASKFGLFKAIVRTIPGQVLSVIPPRLLFVTFMVFQPFLLFRVASSVKADVGRDVAHGLMGATTFIFGGITITRALYEHANYRVSTSIRGILVVAIYDKLQRLPVDELKKAAAVTLMTTDVEAVKQILSLAYELCTSAIQVSAGVWSLSVFVGPACFLMLVPGIFSFVTSKYLGKSTGASRAAWNKKIESRVAATSNILAQIKSIKCMGLEEAMIAKLQEKREEEIKTSLQYRKWSIWLFGLGALSYVVSPLIVFTAAYFWTRASNPMSVAEVFAVLAIVGIASDPFITFLANFSQWSGGFASLHRIRDYLLLDEVCDERTVSAADESAELCTEKSTQDERQRRRSGPFAIHLDAVTVLSSLMSPILKDVSLQIPWGALAVLRGSVNVGKSTLLRSIIGETKLASGAITVGTKSMAYCDQESWMQNRTLRENVTGVLEFVEGWYREVIYCCGLDIDIMSLTNGDQFMTGTGGCNLSGGQKQRVSLARAAYARTEVMVVDDVMSSLDTETAQFVFDKLFGPDGLVRRWNCTVIMATNRPVQLRGDSDMSLEMHEEGRIEQKQRHLGGTTFASSSGSNSASEKGSRASASNVKKHVGANDDAALVDKDAGTQPEDSTSLPAVVPSGDDSELTNARAKKKYGDWSLYRYFLGSAGMGPVAFWITTVAIAAVIQSMPFIFIRIWYGKDSSNPYYFIGYVAVSAATVAMNSSTGAYYFYQIVPKSSNELHHRLAHTTMHATPRYLGQTDAGNLLNRFSQDMSLTAQFLPIIFMQFVYACFSVLVEVGIIASGSIYTLPIMVFIFVVLEFVQHFYLRTTRQLRLLELESSSALFTHFTETSDGIQHIRSLQWQPQFRAQLYDALNRSQKPYYFLFCCQRWLAVVLDFTTTAAAVILVVLSLSLPEATTSGAVGLAMLSLIGFSDNASLLIQCWTNLETGLGAISRVKSFCGDTPTEEDVASDVSLEADWPSKGRIELSGVVARYESDDGNGSQKVLDDVTFVIQPGEKVGISGRTGSGKSSTFMAILRMMDYAGTITIDGQDTALVPRKRLRSRITTLTQDGLLLQGSIRFNLYPFAGKKPDDELIQSTLERIGLWEHIASHGGLDGDVAAVSLSSSQKQLFFLARGILHQKTNDTKIVLMDEATSAMDAGTDMRLQGILDASFAGCTVLQIAHGDAFQRANARIHLDLGQLVSIKRVPTSM